MTKNEIRQRIMHLESLNLSDRKAIEAGDTSGFYESCIAQRLVEIDSLTEKLKKKGLTRVEKLAKERRCTMERGQGRC